jgi:GT2 family glycosyltransferase
MNAEPNNLADVSIIIPTIEINSLTQKCVKECLEHCSGAAIYVVVDFKNDQSLPNEDVNLIVSGNCTIAAKRNMAAQASSSRYLAFIDSDAFPRSGWLENAINILQVQENTWAVGGPNVSPPDEGLSERLVGLSQKSILIAGFNNFRKQFKPPRFCDDLPSCNLIVRREEFLKMDGMNEMLITGEDMDFCHRLRKMEKQIYYSPDVVVYHKNRCLKNYVLQRLTYGASVFELIEMTNSKTMYLLFVPAAAVLFFLSGFLIHWYPDWKYVYLPVVIIYLLLVLSEGVKYSEKIYDFPGVVFALVIGNLAPALGTIAKLTGTLPDRKKIYKNT